MLCCLVLQLRGCQKSFSFNVFRRWLFGQGWLADFWPGINKKISHLVRFLEGNPTMMAPGYYVCNIAVVYYSVIFPQIHIMKVHTSSTRKVLTPQCDRFILHRSCIWSKNIIPSKPTSGSDRIRLSRGGLRIGFQAWLLGIGASMRWSDAETYRDCRRLPSKWFPRCGHAATRYPCMNRPQEISRGSLPLKTGSGYSYHGLKFVNALSQYLFMCIIYLYCLYT